MLSYHWSLPCGLTSDEQNPVVENLTSNDAGTYTVTLVVTDQNGCTGQTVIEVVVNSELIPEFDSFGPYCVGDNPGLLPAISKNGIQGTWSPAFINTGLVGTTVYTFTPEPGECAGIATMTIEVNSCTDNNTFCTYTIGFYGNRWGKACVDGKQTTSACIMISALDQTNGYFTFGSKYRNFTLFKFDIFFGNIYRMLPGGGPAKAFTGPSTFSIMSTWKFIPLSTKWGNMGRSQNILLSQLLAYYFNLNINPDLATFNIENYIMGTVPVYCGSGQIIPGSDEKYFVFPASILNYLRASSVYSADAFGLFKLANDAIGGKVTGINLNDLADALAFMNEGFNECRSLVGWYSNIPGKIITSVDEITEIAEPKVSVYPNPFSDRVFFEFDFNTDGNALLEIYDIKGSKISTLYNNRVESGVKYRIEYSPENVVPGMLLYRLVKDGRVFQGKLIYK